MFRQRKSSSSTTFGTTAGTQRAGLRDITNTAANAVKPVSKKSSAFASLRPISKPQSSRSSTTNHVTVSARAPRADTRHNIDEIDRPDIQDPQVGLLHALQSSHVLDLTICSLRLSHRRASSMCRISRATSAAWR